MGKIIDVDENVFNGVSSQCNNAASSVEGSKGKLGPCFSGKLLSYYNSSCNNKIDSQITSISNNLQNLSTSIQGAMKAYQATDENLAIGFEALIDEIFNYSDTDLDDFSFDQEFSSSNLSSVEERKQYIENLINTYSEVLNNIKNEFSSKYSEAYGRHYLDNIDPKTYAVLDTLMTCFINGGSYYGDGASYNPNTNKGSFTIDQLKRFNNFIKENNLSKTLDSYFSGKSWDASGMSTFNDIVAGNLTGSNYNYGEYDRNVVSDCVEASFLGHFYYNLKKLGLGDGIECTTLGGNISNLVNGGTNNVDKNEVAKIKNLMGDYYKNTFSYQSRFDDKENKYGLLDYIDTRVNEYDSYVSDIKLLESAIYNYRQAKELFSFQKYIESDEFQKFLEGDFQKLKDMYSKKIGVNSKYLNDEEIALYGYLFDKVSEDEAKSYLKALTDKINNAIGMEEALNFIKSRDELGMDFGDVLATMFEGEFDGVEGFYEGIGKFVCPTSPRTALDYKMMYLMEILNNPDKYGLKDLRLTEGDRKIIEGAYNVFYGAGNMLVPQLIGLASCGNPAISAMALALLGTSAAGHATNDAALSGHGLIESYLYGGLTGASEALFESIGGVLGLGDTNLLNFSGWSFVKEYVKSMVKEGTEEFFQEYFDAGLRAVILGEPFDLGETTKEALVAGLYGMAVAGVMNTKSVLLNVAGHVIRVPFSDIASIDLENLSDAEVVTVLEELGEKTIQNIITENGLWDFENVLDYINENNLSRGEASDILNASIETMTGNIESDSGKIVKIYSELMKLLHYDETFNMKKDADRIESNLTILDLEGKDVICTEFSTIFADLLSRAGIDEEKIKFMRKGQGHGWIEVKLDDGRVLIADATNSVSGRIDLTSGKAGLDFVGLVILDPMFSGDCIRDIYLISMGLSNDPSLNTPFMMEKAKEILAKGYANVQEVIKTIGELNIGDYEVVSSLVNGEGMSINDKMKLINDIKDQVDMTSIEWLQIIRKIFGGDITESRHENGTKNSWAIIKDDSVYPPIYYKIEIKDSKVQIYTKS